jgi:hypothetical protein
MLSVSLALADDFKTINGKEYKDATVTRAEADGIVVKNEIRNHEDLLHWTAERGSAAL